MSIYSKNSDNVVNVKNFGALGNGVADDTTAIQAAIDSIQTASAGGGTVYFPSGRYVVSSALSITGSNVRLAGDAAYYAGDINDYVDNCSCLLTNSASINIIEISPPSINGGKVSVENLRIYRPRALTPTGDGIAVDCSSYFYNGLNLRNVTLRCHKNGLSFNGAQGAGIISIRDCWIVINAEWGIYAESYVTNFSITGSVVRQNGDDDVGSSTSFCDSGMHGGICFDGTADAAFLAGNDFEGQNVGLRFDSIDGLVVQGNYFEDCANCGIACWTSSGDIVIEGNTMTATTPQDCAIFLSRCYGGGRIQNNTNQQVYLRECVDIDTPSDTMTPLSTWNVGSANHTFLATRASKIHAPVTHDKNNLSFAGLHPTSAVWEDTDEIAGPFGISRHVKKLTADATNGYTQCDVVNIPTPAVGEYMCASTFIYVPSGNTLGPTFTVFENIDGSGAEITTTYGAMTSIPRNEWVLFRFVRRVDASVTHDLYMRCSVPTSGEFHYLYGNHAGLYGQYPDLPQVCNVTEEARYYPCMDPANLSSLGNAVPTTGTWSVGERVYDATPSTGQPIGWVCTASGIPGTWLGFGDVA